MLKLRDYQREAIDKVKEHHSKGTTRQLVVLPTGAGKTVVFSALAKELTARTLIIAHREELIQQAANKVKMVWPESRPGVVMADRDEVNRQVVVGSIQTCARPKRLDKLGQQNFDLCIVDEAHHTNAKSYTTVLEELGFMVGSPDKLLVGVTATAARGDGKGLGKVFESVVYERNIAEMISEGYLVDVRGYRISTKTNLDDVQVNNGDFIREQLSATINTPVRNQVVVQSYQDHCKGRKAVCFTADVAHAQALSEAFREAGISSQAVWGDMPVEQRRALLRRFSAGEYQVLCNCALLTEGWDEPSVEAVLMARPTKSTALYIQCVGRGLRLYPGKTECLVLDYSDSSKQSLCSVSDLIGREVRNGERVGQKLRESRIEEILAGLEAIISGYDLDSGSEPVGPVDYNVRPMDLLGRSNLRWYNLPGGSFRLPVGQGRHIHVQKAADGNYLVSLQERGKIVELLSEEAIPIGYATGIAEEYAREHAGKLTAKDAGWRQNPATEAQIEALMKKGYTPDTILTRGEASDLLEELSIKQSSWRHEPATHKQKWALRSAGIEIPEFCTKGQATDLLVELRRRAV